MFFYTSTIYLLNVWRYQHIRQPYTSVKIILLLTTNQIGLSHETQNTKSSSYVTFSDIDSKNELTLR